MIAIQKNQPIGFDIKRCYYIFDNSQNVIRGKHAHRFLRQLLVCLSGSLIVDCEFNGQKETHFLNDPSKALLIEGLVWREMREFSPGCVLLVLASEEYSETDYIRNYKNFKETEKKCKKK